MKYLLVFLLLTTTVSAQVVDGTFPVVSNLKAGAAKVDITPEEVKDLTVSGHTRVVNGVRDPLRAGVLVLDDGETKAAIVTLDVVVAWDDLVTRARAAIEKEIGVPAANIMVCASHNHSGPGWEENPQWATGVITKLASAAKEAGGNMRSVSVGMTEDRIGFSINRRKTIDGRAVIRLNPDGPNDSRVKVLRFDDGRSLTPLAIIMHAVCHPYRCADEADIQWAGRDLGSAVVRAAAFGMIREQLAKRATFYPIRVASEVIELPGKEQPVRTELMAMKIGPFLLLSMPGEPMVEYGFKLEAAIADRITPIIVGYANGNVGYISTADSYEVGGYEPNTSKLLPEAEPIILKHLGGLADRVIGDVFESISKHPKDLQKREAEEKARLKSVPSAKP